MIKNLKDNIISYIVLAVITAIISSFMTSQTIQINCPKCINSDKHTQETLKKDSIQSKLEICQHELMRTKETLKQISIVKKIEDMPDTDIERQSSKYD